MGQKTRARRTPGNTNKTLNKMLTPRSKQSLLLSTLVLVTIILSSRVYILATAWIPTYKRFLRPQKLVPYQPIPHTHFRGAPTSATALHVLVHDEASQFLAAGSVLLEDPLSEKYIELIDPPMKVIPNHETTELVLIKPAMAGVDWSSPYIQSELLDNLSHFFGDLLVLLAPSTAFVRLFVALGRFFGIASEYVDDNMLSFDDALIDSTLLVIAILLFTKSVTPIIQASFEVLDERDEYAYCQLFEPVGISETQHKTMKRTCIDWVEDLEPGTVVVGDNDTAGESIDGDDADCVYWLYEGSVTVSFTGVPIKDITADPDNGQCSLDATCIDEYCALGLLADMRFLYNLDHMDRRNKVAVIESDGDNTEPRYPTTTIGPGGATLMRIRGKNLFGVMENDQKLGLAIRELLVTSLKRDVEFLLNASSRGVLLRGPKEEKAALAPKRRRVADCPIYETFYDGSF